MKGFLVGGAIVIIAVTALLSSGASIPALAFRPGGMISQGAPINRQNSSGATASISSCNPTSDHPGFRCIPRGPDGSVGQLGGVIPYENPKLPNRYFAYEGK